MCYRKIAAAISCVLVLSVCLTPIRLYSEELRIEGEIEKVVAYQGQALVTRRVPIDFAAGEHEIVITQLPERIIPESLYAEGAEGILVRSTRYRERAVEKDVREEVRKLDQRIAEEKLELKNEKSEIEKKLETARRERSMISGRSTHTLKEAVVFVSCEKDVQAEFELYYLVDRVNWKPSYIARVGEERGEAELEYLIARPEETLTVSYSLPGRTSLPSRLDRQSFRITAEQLHYVKNRKPEGILRWDVQVPVGASGLDAFTVEYTLRIEHDRHKTFSDPAQDR